jgi:hypothetical protein
MHKTSLTLAIASAVVASGPAGTAGAKSPLLTHDNTAPNPEPQSRPKYSSELVLRPTLLPILWDAHERFMKEKRSPACFYVVAKAQAESVEISYIRLTKHVKVEEGDDPLFLSVPVCPAARSMNFRYSPSGQFLGRTWNR